MSTISLRDRDTVTTAEPGWEFSGPVAETERIVPMDVLRGFALLGILVINIQSFAMVGAAYDNPTAYGDLNGANFLVWLFSHLLADQKFISIFAMLFGAGIVLMWQKAESSSGRAGGVSPLLVHVAAGCGSNDKDKLPGPPARSSCRAKPVWPPGSFIHWLGDDCYSESTPPLCFHAFSFLFSFLRRCLADTERMTTGPRPVPENGTRLRAMASSIRRATSGRASVDAPSRLIERVWLPDPCNNFAGSGNSLPRLKYSFTPFALARIARTPSYPCVPVYRHFHLCPLLFALKPCPAR
ncbi:MAG: hypothetical protein E6I43_14035 [Chloroflexi bacterium]|nr:MAG: hypothetical protein E6I43_14035 [Chloroflexota bacterium]